MVNRSKIILDKLVQINQILYLPFRPDEQNIAQASFKKIIPLHYGIHYPLVRMNEILLKPTKNQIISHHHLTFKAN